MHYTYHQKPANMKRFIAIAFLGLILTVFAASCGASKGHCEAYDGGTYTNQVESFKVPE